MSVLNKLKGKGSNGDKKDWTPEQVKVAIGMKLQGASRKDIGLATGHFSTDDDGKIRANTVTYVLTRRFVSKDENGELVADDDKLNAFIGQTPDGRNYGEQDFIDFANNFLKTETEESA